MKDWDSILQFARTHRNDDVRALALNARAYTGIDLLLALQQISGRRIASSKLPQWAACDDIVYGPQLAMEQCSSQFTAQYKAALVTGDSITDLTGGLGVDFSFMSSGRRGTYVERQQQLCDIAEHNFGVLALDARVVCGDGVEYLREMESVDTIYIDPARRDHAGNRVFALEDCTPDVTALAPLMLEKAETVIIKLSPMLDHRAAVKLLPCVEQVHILSVKGECKELLLVLKRGYDGEVTVHCINDNEQMHFVMGAEAVSATVWDEKSIPVFLYEPNASIMKAGCYGLLAQRENLSVVSLQSHLLVGEHRVDDFPGRAFRVEAVSTMNKKELKNFVAGLTHANVAVRNFPIKAPELARRLRLKDGGDTYIFGTTTSSSVHLLFKARRV